MNCQRFEIVVSELARGRMMAASDRSEALAHSETCENCALRLEQEQALTSALQSLAVEMNRLDAPRSVETGVLKAFRAQKLVVPPANKRSNHRYWLAAVAAMLLLATSVVALRWRTDTGKQRPEVAIEQPQPEREQSPRPVPVNDTPREQEQEYQAMDQTPQRKERKPLRRPRARQSENAQVANHVREIATDFIPLRYGNAASLQDGGQIVRVELPRSALANFGLPVNMDRYHEKVKADVIFGVDGMAHAIRFVQ